MIDPIALDSKILEQNGNSTPLSGEIWFGREVLPSKEKLPIESHIPLLNQGEEKFFEHRQITAFGALSFTTFLGATLSKGNLFTLLFSSSIGFGLCASSLALHSYLTDYRSENP